jgi:glycosyltransferase involved in cell wall biosynthesis
MTHPSKRLLIAFHEMHLGGIQKKTVDIIKQINRRFPGTPIRLCLRRKEGIFLQDLPPEVVVTASKYKFYRLGIIWYIVWMIKEVIFFRPTHILAFMDFSVIPTFIALKFVFWRHPKVIIGEDILTSKYLTDLYGTVNAPIREALIKKYYPQADWILVQTPVQKADLEKILGLPKSPKIVASPNWLPLDYPPQKIPEFSTRSNDVLFVGRIADQKNLPLFIDIIDKLTSKISNIKAIIVGSGEKETQIRSLINQKKLEQHIDLPGATLHPHPFYNSSKVFLLSSDYEGFPLTLMEAIASGCFPVCRDLPEIRLFFDKYSSAILYKTARSGTRLVTQALHDTPQNQKIKAYYQQKLIRLQQKNINRYINYCLGTGN